MIKYACSHLRVRVSFKQGVQAGQQLTVVADRGGVTVDLFLRQHLQVKILKIAILIEEMFK